MSTAVLTLEHFSQPTAVCVATASVESLLALAQSNLVETIVLVDQQGYPLGTISWRQLLQYVLECWQESPFIRTIEPLIDLKSLMLPMKVLSAQMTINEFRDWRHNHPDSQGFYQYGLVDKKNKFIGLLNCERLWELGYSSGFPKSELLFQEFLQQFPLPLMMGSRSRPIIQQNKPWQEQIGGSFAVFSEPIYQYCPVSQALENHFPSNHQGICSHRLTHLDRVWEFVTIPLSFLAESEPTWLVMAWDVTEQAQYSQALVGKNADLTHLNRLKDQFLDCISHELKSPLTSVIGLSTLLKKEKIGKLNERQSRYAEMIYQSGHQLMTLLNDLLDLTRLETGQLKLTPTWLDIRQVCQRAYQTIFAKYQTNGDRLIPFTLSIAPHLEQVLADDMRLQQMLVYLLDNAIKFSQDGEAVGIKVDFWGDWLAFTVWDKGSGIPEECQSLIFEKFRQPEGPLTPHLEGIGLVLTQNLAKAHGGDISFISQVGKGSQFTILLPSSPVTTPDTQAGSTFSPLILIVETIPQIIHDLYKELTLLGYPVVVARTGTEALEKARQLHPGRIFLNPLLPLLSGWDVLNLLKSDAETASIPIIIINHQENPFPQEFDRAAGFLSLPLELEKLKVLLPEAPPLKAQNLTKLTILQLYLPNQPEDTSLNLLLGAQLSNLNCRLLSASSLEQGEMIASVWDVDVVILDGNLETDSGEYLQHLSHCQHLANLPLVTLGQNLTESANKVSNLAIFPCLLPPGENNMEQLIQIIEIAAQSHR